MKKRESIKKRWNQANKQLIAIIAFSFILFLISLLLPAFGFYTSTGNGREWITFQSGAEVLLFGIFLGWLSALLFANIGALSGYANLVYLILILLLLIDKKNIKILIGLAIIMLFLASISLTHKEMSGGEIAHMSLGDPIYFWGYGAFLWFFSLATLSSVPLIRGFTRKLPSVWFYIIAFAVCFGLITKKQSDNFEKANELERKSYFAKNIILTTKKMSGIEYNPPKNIKDKLHIDESTVIDITEAIHTDKINLHKIVLKKFQTETHFWHVYDTCNQYSCPNVAELSPKKPVDYFYKTNTNNNRKTKSYTIKNSASQVIWDVTSRQTRNTKKYFPNYEKDLYELFAELKTPMMNVDSDDFAQKTKEQIFTLGKGENCQFSQYKDMSDAIELNGKIFVTELDNIKDFQVWCSQDYMIIVKNTLTFGKWNELLLFQKNPTKPVKTYFIYDKFNHYHWNSDVLEEKGLLDKSTDEKYEQMINYPNANKIKSLRFEYAYRSSKLKSKFEVVNKEDTSGSRSVIVATTEVGEFLFDSAY